MNIARDCDKKKKKNCQSPDFHVSFELRQSLWDTDIESCFDTTEPVMYDITSNIVCFTYLYVIIYMLVSSVCVAA